MLTTNWLYRLIQNGISARTRRVAQVFTLALTSALVAHAGVVVGYYQGSNASLVPPKNLVTNGSAGELNYLIYAFMQPDANGSCSFASSTDQATATQTAYTAANSVSGVADSGSGLKGTFNQLQELKTKYKNLKVLISLGGSAYSGNFSAMASAVAAAEAKNPPTNPAASCVDMLINGNFTSTLKGYSGIFDGIDIDWEYPGSKDQSNYTALLKAFRSELNKLATTNGKTYYLTATMGPAKNSDGTQYINVAAAAESLDYVNVMSYDYMGAWSGGTGTDAPLFSSALNTGSSYNITDSLYFTYNVSATMTENSGGVEGLIPEGVPASKLLLGIPFYGLQWKNVASDTYHGIYETGSWVGTPSYATIVQTLLPQASFTQYCDYGNQSNPYTCTANAGGGSQETWLYDGSSNFVSFDNEVSVASKVSFAKTQNLAGVMVWDLSQDSPGGCLMNAVWTSMSTANKPLNQDTALYNFESGVQNWTHTTGITAVGTSEGQAFAGCKSLGVTFGSDSFEAAATAYVQNPSNIKPGQTIQIHVFIPAGSTITAVNPFITDTSWNWLASDYQALSNLHTGQWNTFSFTVPSNAPTTFGELGVQFSLSGPWSGQVYIDSVNN